MSERVNEPAYEIDTRSRSISFYDKRTGELRIEDIDELLELAFWLKGRESDLRAMVHQFARIESRQLMHLVNGFWLGQTSERMLIRVADSDYQVEKASVGREAADQWAERHNERARHLTHYDSVFNVSRQPLYLTDPSGRSFPAAFNASGQLIPIELAKDELTERNAEDCPPDLIYEAQQKLMRPEYWVAHPKNMDMGRRAKLP